MRRKSEENNQASSEAKFYEVDSFTDKNKSYTVRQMPNGDWRCSCPHFVFKNQECKHIRKVKMQEAATLLPLFKFIFVLLVAASVIAGVFLLVLFLFTIGVLGKK